MKHKHGISGQKENKTPKHIIVNRQLLTTQKKTTMAFDINSSDEDFDDLPDEIHYSNPNAPQRTATLNKPQSSQRMHRLCETQKQSPNVSGKKQQSFDLLHINRSFDNGARNVGKFQTIGYSPMADSINRRSQVKTINISKATIMTAADNLVKLRKQQQQEYSQEQYKTGGCGSNRKGAPLFQPKRQLSTRSKSQTNLSVSGCVKIKKT